MLRVVIPFWNAKAYLQRCLLSVQSQAACNWHAYLLDDCSDDGSGELAEHLAADEPRVTTICNAYKHFVPGNYSQVMARPEVEDQDIIVNLDGDDMLPDPLVFSRVQEAYADPAVWLTWGCFVRLKEGRIKPGFCRPVVDVTTVRKLPWVTSHLRTFKAFLFRAIYPYDLRSPTGEFWEVSGDVAMMYPMLEMATNTHARFLRDVNYYYTDDNPISDNRVARTKQLQYEQILRRRPRYKPLHR